MGRRGPAPTPTRLLELRGSWRAETRQGEPTSPPACPTPPSELRRPAKRVYRSVVCRLREAGLATRLDERALARYCELAVQFHRAVERVEKGEEDESRMLSLDRALMRHEDRFGLSPSARARLVVGAKEEPPSSQEDYFGEAQTG